MLRIFHWSINSNRDSIVTYDVVNLGDYMFKEQQLLVFI